MIGELIDNSFLIQSSNALFLLTSPEYLRKTDAPPRITQFELLKIIEPLNEDTFISNQPYIVLDKDQIPKLKQRARWATSELTTHVEWGTAYLPKDVLHHICEGFEETFRTFTLFGLVVGKFKEPNTIAELLRRTANKYRRNALLFDSSSDENNPSFSCLDPLPATTLLAEQIGSWPGLLIWAKSGEAALVPEAALLAQRPLEEIFSKIQVPSELDKVLAQYKEERREPRILVHLSDLHFGRKEALSKAALLLTHLNRKLRNTDRVVITGDILMSPSKGVGTKDEGGVAGDAYNIFHAGLCVGLDEHPIVIPGNHDVRWRGCGARQLESLVELFDRCPNVIADKGSQTLFFCFNSNYTADPVLARGEIDDAQIERISLDFESKAQIDPGIRNMLKVALIHHHPFSWVKPDGGFLRRRYRKVEEKTLILNNPENFLKWCADMDVSIILHGHKHEPRYVEERLDYVDRWGQERSTLIHSIGCGTSLAAEGYPMCYDVLVWDAARRKWAVSFWEDGGNGVFKPMFVKVENLRCGLGATAYGYLSWIMTKTDRHLWGKVFFGVSAIFAAKSLYDVYNIREK
jgi:hypothetical protein